MLLIWYPKCSTCQKAKKWLEERGIPHETRDIRQNPPTALELLTWMERGELPLRRFFNTSGQRYRALELARRLPELTQEEQLELLSSDGMLVKRPVLVGEDLVLLGFRPEEWTRRLG